MRGWPHSHLNDATVIHKFFFQFFFFFGVVISSEGSNFEEYKYTVKSPLLAAGHLASEDVSYTYRQRGTDVFVGVLMFIHGSIQGALS